MQLALPQIMFGQQVKTLLKSINTFGILRENATF